MPGSRRARSSTTPRPEAKGATVLLTGVTGFVGKVVLERMLARREELGVKKVVVLIRARKGERGAARFVREVASSRCFAALTAADPHWSSVVEIVDGDLTRPALALDGDVRKDLASRLTHILHCAASVEFDLPVADALAVNTDGALEVLGLAKECTSLVQMVGVSTAYVSPQTQGAVDEVLAPLTRPATELYRQIKAGDVDEDALLAETGHPNTYTLTKCIMEHLLCAERGSVPLTLVRPSIISASWAHPEPGWIDSHATIAGFVSLIGSGWMRTVIADPRTALDIVPCDEVATRVLDAGFLDGPGNGNIVHAVAGVPNACRIEDCGKAMVRFYGSHRIDREPKVYGIIPDGPRSRTAHRLVHTLPIALGARAAKLVGQKKLAKKLNFLGSKIELTNGIFSHFTHNTFDFRSSKPLDLPGFTQTRYLDLICAGVHRNLFKKDETSVPLAGAVQGNRLKDALRAIRAKQGTPLMRFTGYTLARGFARGASLIDFNRASFEAALAQTPSSNLHVLVPSHRSYIDFLITAYLAYAAPELNIKLPHIAAAEEFSKIFILGNLLQRMQAFYIKRNAGKADPELDARIRELVAREETLMFFIEGERSRSRRFLIPKRGLLRSLQSTGEACTLLPIAISYDRVSEERSFVSQLEGGDKPRMRLRTLLGWTQRLLKGEIDMGRIHLRCGNPIELHSDSDVHAVSRTVMRELQSAMAVSTDQLEAFVRFAHLASEGVTATWLAEAIRKRGGIVIEGKLRTPNRITRVVERTMRYHWMHVFYPEARAMFGGHPALEAHLALNDFGAAGWVPTPPEDAHTRSVVQALFSPVLEDYAATLDEVAVSGNLNALSAKTLVRQERKRFLPDVEAALQDLCERGILEATEKQGHRRGASWNDLTALRAACDAQRTANEAPAEAPLEAATTQARASA